ncbi:MAG: NAD-dependent deacylase [Candidatus Promineifilaceae bacterium]|nr:NAD-dependent deacylase [Candidatus Promineifilaceae bacterium]
MVNIPEDLIATLRRAQKVTVLTGAGVSAESGVPTFRDAQTGLWAKYDPQELATPQAFRRDPKLVWEWYEWRRELIDEAEPNPAHYALAEMERHVPTFTLITQNIDNLHREAGSHDLVELHGNIRRNKCFEEDRAVTEWEPAEEGPPSCPECGGPLRPDVVWFGEALPQNALATAITATRTCDLFLSIGTSALVHPAAALPLEAVQNGARTVEINPEETPVSAWMDVILAGRAGELLPALVAAAWSADE